MSVIGPRPALWNQDVLTAERDKYGANDVKPGLTGWAQINGRDELEIPVKAKLDGEYVQKEKIKEGFLLRKVAGDHVVVPVGEAGKVFHGMIRLNDTGAFLWEQCRKETTKEQVLQAMAEKYEVDESVAADDLDRFLQQLRNAEILEETNE